MTHEPNQDRRALYKQASKALDAAHRACSNHPDRGPIGMSSGPFSGVNEALGIIAALEKSTHYQSGVIAALEAEITRLRALVERAFRDGITYATNVAVRDASLAWESSKIRANLKPDTGE